MVPAMRLHLARPLVAASAAAAVAAAVALPAVAAAAPVSGQSTLTRNGLGSMRIGMTIDTAQRRTGQHIDYQPFTEGDDACGFAQLEPRRLGVTMLTTNRHIGVLFVASRRVSTPAGIHVGDTPADLRAAYGSRLRSQPNKYDPKARDYSVTTGSRKLVFYVGTDGKIGQMAGGREPEVDYVEGCS